MSPSNRGLYVRPIQGAAGIEFTTGGHIDPLCAEILLEDMRKPAHVHDVVPFIDDVLDKEW
jgi:hypothetical protein